MNMDLLLIRQWGENKYGDIISIGPGLYYSLIDKKIGLPVTCLDEVTDTQNLVEHCKGLEKQLKDIDDKYWDSKDENFELKQKIKILEEEKLDLIDKLEEVDEN